MTAGTGPVDSFREPFDAQTIAKELIERLALTGQNLELVRDLERMIHERDKALEDYLRNHVVHRTHAKMMRTPADVNVGTFTFPQYGILTDSDGADLAIDFTKSSDESLVRVECFLFGAALRFAAPLTGEWLSFGVRFTDQDFTFTYNGLEDGQGTIIDVGGAQEGQTVELARFEHDDGDKVTVAGANLVVGLPAGQHKALLCLSSSDGLGIWRHSPYRTQVIALTETPV